MVAEDGKAGQTVCRTEGLCGHEGVAQALARAGVSQVGAGIEKKVDGREISLFEKLRPSQPVGSADQRIAGAVFAARPEQHAGILDATRAEDEGRNGDGRGLATRPMSDGGARYGGSGGC